MRSEVRERHSASFRDLLGMAKGLSGLDDRRTMPKAREVRCDYRVRTIELAKRDAFESRQESSLRQSVLRHLMD